MPDVTFLFFSFSLNDAIDFLMNTEHNSAIESSSDEEDHDLAMLPPIEKTNAETDMDSDASDDMNDSLVQHLSRRLQIQHVTRVCLTKEINRHLCNTLNPQIRNQENQLQETEKLSLTWSQL